MHVLPAYVVDDATLSSSTAPEADYAAWASGTTYAAGARVIRTTGVHRVFERLAAGAGTTPPEDDTANWLDVAPTNRWAMFDQAVGTSTRLASPLTVVLSLTTYADLVLLGVVGSTVSVSAPGVSRSVAVPAEAVAGQGATVLIQGLAPTGGPVTISITGSGTVACATLAIGTFWQLGASIAEIGLDADDYSVKAFDAFGNATVVRRPVARRLRGSFECPLAGLDACDRVLAALRSRPVMWMGAAWLDATIVYGIAQSWSLRREMSRVVGNLTIRGMAVAL